MKGKDTVSKVEEVLRALPIVATKDAEIRMWAEKLAWGSTIFAVNDLPRATPTTEAKARGEIELFADLSKKLAMHIQSMHANSLDAIRKQKPRNDPLMMFDDLKDSAALKKKALADVSSIPSAPTSRGRPKKRNAGEIASIAGNAYLSLTRRQPIPSTRDGKAYGPFFDFLGQVLDVLEIDAKPEHLARTVARKEKNRAK